MYVLKSSPPKSWKPHMLASSLRGWCCDVAISARFLQIITYTIMLNVVSLMMTKQDMSDNYIMALLILNVFFTVPRRL